MAAGSVQNYIRFLLESGGGPSEVDYFDERALHERAKRRKAEIELAVMNGELHRSGDVSLVMNDMVVTPGAGLGRVPRCRNWTDRLPGARYRRWPGGPLAGR